MSSCDDGTRVIACLTSRARSLLVFVLLGLTAAGCSQGKTAHRGPSPRLGVSSRNSSGFGELQPEMIWTGGDATSEVRHIKWSNWGLRTAVGKGESVWVWPGTCTGCNPFSSARVVAFHLGRCHGHLSYNAVEWYFPQYGDRFARHSYIDSCTHRQVGVRTNYSPTTCPFAPLAGGGTAVELQVEGMSCKTATRIVERLPSGPFKHERRMTQGAFRCGTEGAVVEPEMISCALGERWLMFNATY